MSKGSKSQKVLTNKKKGNNYIKKKKENTSNYKQMKNKQKGKRQNTKGGQLTGRWLHLQHPIQSITH